MAYIYQLGLNKGEMEMTIKTRKIGILGAGNVGSHCGFSLATQGEVDEIVFVDTKKEKAHGEALDLQDAISYLPHNLKIFAGQVEDFRDCDIVIISAGPLPRPDQTRLDSLEDTITSIKNTIPEIVESGFDGIFICISNPADVIADYVRRKSGFPKEKVFSTGTSLDSARLKRALARETGIAPKSIQAFSLGEHGGSQIVPWSNVTIGGKPIIQLKEDGGKYKDIDFEGIQHETRFSGYDVLTGKGSTEFGIASAVTDIVKAIFHDEKRVLPLSVLLEGEYGQTNVHASVPVVVGKNGIQEIIEIELADNEKEGFQKSCDTIREYINLADKY